MSLRNHKEILPGPRENPRIPASKVKTLYSLNSSKSGMQQSDAFLVQYKGHRVKYFTVVLVK